MLYISRNGCLFYYDRVLYNWQIAEPTMLFLLGFESVTMYSKSVSDCLTIAKQKYIIDKNEIEPFNYYNTFEEIYGYLSQLGKVDDLDTYIKSNCYGLKLLINDLAGSFNDRTVPIIFKNDTNKTSIDLTKPMYRIPEGKRLSMSYYDLQAQKIHDIFEDAGYNEDSPVLPISSYPVEYRNYIEEYNAEVSEVYTEKYENSNIYKLLDYSSMYSYSLGVLYGCRCLGFDPTAIWRIDPVYWYNGTFKNLVATAWYTFRFYHTHYIDEIDNNQDHPDWKDKYKGITINRIWNYSNDSDIGLDNPPLYADEKSCYLVSISDNIVSDVIESEYISLNTVNYSERLDGVIDIENSIYDLRYTRSDEIEFPFITFTLIGTDIPSKNIKWIISIESEDPVEVDDSDLGDDKFIGGTLVLYPSSPISKIRLLYTSVIEALNNLYEVSITIEYSNESKTFTNIQPWDSSEEADPVMPPGKYLKYDTESDPQLEWHPISELISSDPMTGIISSDISQPIIRYIGTDKVKIYKAYQWLDEVSYSTGDETIILQKGKYLSPTDEDIYFMATGSFGWTEFDENSWANPESSSNILSFVPVDYNDLPSSCISWARDVITNAIIAYYKGEVTDDRYLYGIFDGRVKHLSTIGGEYDFSELNSNHFKQIISDRVFSSRYDIFSISADYTLESWYDVDTKIDIYVRVESQEYSRNTYMFDGDDTPVLISLYGYTPKPAISIDAFDYDSENQSFDSDGNLIPTSVDLRYFSGSNYGYWSTKFDPIEWKSSHSFYLKSGSTSLYKGTSKLVDSVDTYSNGANDIIYIFNDGSIVEDLGFIPLIDGSDSLYSKYGITTYLCPLVLEDDYGNSLVDESGNPLVWLDQNKDPMLYWNGVNSENIWQEDKPIAQ